jgi:hypothetical protein
MKCFEDCCSKMKQCFFKLAKYLDHKKWPIKHAVERKREGKGVLKSWRQESETKSISNGEFHSRVFYGSHLNHIILKQFTHFLLQQCNFKKLILGPTILPYILIFYLYIILLPLIMFT